MRPLLWKEMRDLRAWVLGGVALVGALELLSQTRQYRNSFEGGYLALLLPLLAVVAAVALGVGQVARERHMKTLDYLLVRPVEPGTIVWTKFLAGTVALALLMAAIVGLGFATPQVTGDNGLLAIREQVGFRAVTLTLFPRYWCVYALTLFFSVLLDRSAKVAAAMAVVAITLMGLISYFTDLAPFSGFVYWLPFFESTGGLVLAARSSGFVWLAGLACGAVAILVTAAGATLLKRSPERYLGNRGLALVAAGMVGAALLSAQAAKVRLPEVAPAGSFEIRNAKEWGSAGIVASGGRVAVTRDGNVRFLDFSNPSNPKLVSEVNIPLWTTSSDWDVEKAAMAGDVLFLVGETKSLPVDEVEIAIVKPDASIERIPLGSVRPHAFTSAPVPVGRFLYVGRTDERVCSIHVFDVASRREAMSVVIDKMRPMVPGTTEGQPPMRICRRGSYLYVASPSALTAIDAGNPAQPVVTSQLQYHPKAQFLYGFPRALAWQDNRMFEIEFWPYSLGSFDLSDPAHPAAKGDLTWHAGLALAGSGRDLYLPWRAGVLESRAEGGGLQTRRYLRGGGTVSALAIDGEYLYALTGVDSQKRRMVQAFRVW